MTGNAKVYDPPSSPAAASHLGGGFGGALHKVVIGWQGEEVAQALRGGKLVKQLDGLRTHAACQQKGKKNCDNDRTEQNMNCV